MRLPMLLIATCFALAACGGDSSPQPRPGVEAELDQDGLDTVHDVLYECLRKAGGGVLARYLNGQASVSDSFAKAEYDDQLAAPQAERAVLDNGVAQFIGIRANRRDPEDRGRADVDVLIFRSDDRALESLPAIKHEAPAAEQDGIYVRIVKRPGTGGRTLKRCFNEARPGG